MALRFRLRESPIQGRSPGRRLHRRLVRPHGVRPSSNRRPNLLLNRVATDPLRDRRRSKVAMDLHRVGARLRPGIRRPVRRAPRPTARHRVRLPVRRPEFLAVLLVGVREVRFALDLRSKDSIRSARR